MKQSEKRSPSDTPQTAEPKTTPGRPSAISKSLPNKIRASIPNPANISLARAADVARREDKRVVGLKDAALLSKSEKNKFSDRRKLFLDAASLTSTKSGYPNAFANPSKQTIEEKEEIARKKAVKNPFVLLILGNLAALRVFVYYLLTLESLIACGLTAGMTVYWYNIANDRPDWSGSGLDFVILAFAVTSPISAAIGMAFTRRENALIQISEIRSSAHQIYVAHSMWDWAEKGGRENSELNLRVHSDAVLAQLVGIADEISRFLTLPTASRSRHRMTRQGRREAARTIEVAYHLMQSMVSERMTRLGFYGEDIKKAGLSPGEVSRIRQYERFIESGIEKLRMIKMYRTPQALRSFARLFTFALPPFYAPKFAQLAVDVQSLPVGIMFGVITALGLTALFESLQVLEDPFVGYLALDGIDVREEFEVLLFSSLVQTRARLFPEAPPYPVTRRAALAGASVATPSEIPSQSEATAETVHKADVQVGTDSRDKDTSVDAEEGTDNSSNSTLANQEFGTPLTGTEEADQYIRQSNFSGPGAFHARTRTLTGDARSVLNFFVPPE